MIIQSNRVGQCPDFVKMWVSGMVREKFIDRQGVLLYMKYRNYNNGIYYFLLGIMLISLFGGIRIITELFGVMLGLLINLFPLILVGIGLYYIANTVKKNRTIDHQIHSQTVDNKRFCELFIHVITHVIKADDKTDHREIQAVLNYFRTRLNYPEEKLIWITDLLHYSEQKHFSLSEVCLEFSAKFNYEAKLLLLDLVYEVALSDQALVHAEQEVIDEIVTLLGISRQDHDGIRFLFGISKVDDATKHYAILGLSPGASKDGIKKAYREACKKNHPDRVHHLGGEFKKVAEEKMHKINDSYAYLMKI